MEERVQLPLFKKNIYYLANLLFLIIKNYLQVLQSQQANMEIDTPAGRASIENTSFGYT